MNSHHMSMTALSPVMNLRMTVYENLKGGVVPLPCRDKGASGPNAVQTTVLVSLNGHKLGVLNKNSLSHSLGGWKPKIKGVNSF